MAATAGVVITGITELRDRFGPDRLRAAILAGLRDGLQPIARSAAGLAPRRTGRLAGSIRATAGGKRGELMGAIVDGVPYGHLVEYGHRIAQGGRLLPRGFVSLTRRARFRGVTVGQVPPHPFARPAFASGEANVTAAIERRLVALIHS